MGSETTSVDPEEIVRTVRERSAQDRRRPPQDSLELDIETDREESWHDALLFILREMPPDSFERLCQRLLRESGFVNVEVTGRSGDGGIDGYGLLRLGGLLSFRALFQCKRYSGNVVPSQVRDFRGAMIGRADKGLIITTGGFTREARLEAARDGAPPIDLIDGEQLIDKLKELGLGVRTELVENVQIDRDWFDAI